MARLVREAKRDYSIRAKALALLENIPQKAWGAEISALHAFVRDGVRYVKDVNGIETLQTPIKTLEIRQGDCDDKSTLLAALLESVGHPSRFVAVALNGGPYSHVLVETRIGNRWIPLETTENVAPGWYPKNVTSRMVEHI